MLWCLRFVDIGAGGIDGIDREHWHCEQRSGTCDVASAGGVGEQAVVADAVEALWQHPRLRGGRLCIRNRRMNSLIASVITL